MVLGTWLCPLEHAETRLSPSVIHFLLEARVCSEAHTLGPPDEVWEPWKCLHEARCLKTLLRWYSGPLCILARSEGTSDKDNTILRNKIPNCQLPCSSHWQQSFFFQCAEWEQGTLCQPLPGLKRDAHCTLLALRLANA